MQRLSAIFSLSPQTSIPLQPLAENTVEDTPYPDDPDGDSFPSYEQSTLLASERLHDDEEDEEYAREVSSWKTLPWWKRPSPYWLIFTMPLGSIAFSAVLAPKVAMYTSLVCRVHRPEYFTNDHSLLLPSTRNSAADVSIPSISDGSETLVNTVVSNTPLSDHIQTGLDFEQQCTSDPVVQAIVARLNAVFSTSMGVLSCLTIGWWGSLSDRYGRRVVIVVSIFGLFATDITHIITAWFVDVLPGKYWFILVGFLIEGLCGSASAGVAANHAYLADTTDPSTISRYLSLSLGFMFTGVAIGPVLGGLLIHSTGTTLFVFYFTFILHAIYGTFILLVLPESLTRARARGARLRHRQQASSDGALGIVKRFVRFLSPLAVLLPEKPLDASPLKQARSDRSIFFIAIAYGVVTTLYGSFSYKLQYAAAQFHWTPESTSYYVSFIGATRAMFLAGGLPLILKYLKAKHFQLSAHGVPLQDFSGPSPSHCTDSFPGAPQNDAEKHNPAPRFPVLDLAVARISAGIDTLAYVALTLASTGTLYAVASTIGSFSAGFSPATQALALDIYTNRRSQNKGEVGKLFGALSVVHTLGAHIIGPGLYGFVYSNTVATFPQAIMILSLCTTLVSFIFLSLVRIPPSQTGSHAPSGDENEEECQGMLTPEILTGLEDDVVEDDKEAMAVVMRY